jgi:hypothetical protein
LDRPVRAGEAFLVLARDDPETPYFDCIPLAWTPRPLAAAGLESSATQWIQRPEPAAILLGASHLLGGRAETAALARLRELTTTSDRRVAPLAMAQIWRAAVATAGDAEREKWEGATRQIPQELAAGPYYVLGRARAQQQQWQRAALAWMRVPILYPQHRTLAAQSLLEAGRSLERLDRQADALRLYRELLRDYPERTMAVAEARSRIETMQKEP